MENPFRFKTHREKYATAEENLKNTKEAMQDAETNGTGDQNRLVADEKKAQDKVAKLEGQAWNDAHNLEDQHRDLQENIRKAEESVRKAQEALSAFEQKELGMRTAGAAKSENQ